MGFRALTSPSELLIECPTKSTLSQPHCDSVKRINSSRTGV
jgi:glycosyltransferase involved in cell wall biosynthesis